MAVGIAFVVALMVMVALIVPFFVGPGGRMVQASSENSAQTIEQMQKAILARYLDDEKAYKGQMISKQMWKQRQQFLANRYVDVSRRLDYLQGAGEGDRS